MKLIDLTIPLDDKTPTYPGDSPMVIKQVDSVSEGGCGKKSIDFHTHCGTHIDAPEHMVEGGKTLDDFPLEKFMGKGIIIDVRNKEITLDCLNDVSIEPESVVLFLTGQSDKLYENYYEGASFLSEDVAHELVRKQVKAVGIDSFGPDEEPYPVHKILLPNDIIIIENLTNLDKLLDAEFDVCYFPLKITKGDGSPCRVVAMVN